MEILINIIFRTAMILPHLLRENFGMNRTIYGHETSSVTLKGRNKFIMISSKILRTIFGPKWMK